MKLTYILPVIEYQEDYIKKCIDSLKFEYDEKLIVVGPENIMSKMGDATKTISQHTTLLVNNGETDFCSQINLAAKNVSTEYFSIIEFDDTYTEKWMSHVKEHAHAMGDVSLFLPLVLLTDESDENSKALANELSWSTAFANDLGYIDTECLESFYDFYVVGGVFKTNDFIEVGGFKSSLKIASTFELLLRMAHNGMKIYTIPRVGYKHTCGRKGSCMVTYGETISKEEGEWLIKTAKEERYFKEDRKKTFGVN